jgi:hypothetical protein
VPNKSLQPGVIGATGPPLCFRDLQIADGVPGLSETEHCRYVHNPAPLGDFRNSLTLDGKH